MIGTTLSHYEILEELGRGGMGIVYRAMDTKLDRTVAIKVLPPAALSSEDDRARFYREAKAAARLNHPHIAAVYQIDEAVPSGSSEEAEARPFIAMEYIEGGTLDDRLKEGLLSLEEAVRICSEVAEALEAAHEAGVVHRDIKSSNIMLTTKGQAKVLDFGLAMTAHSTMLTRMGSTLGTAAYMSPEQAQSSDVDHRTDLWALGVVLYEMIASRLPFAGDYEQAITYSILNVDPDPLTSIRTGVPMGLEWIVSKLLAKRADDRYQNAGDLLVDLRNVDLSDSGRMRSSSVQSRAAVSSTVKSGRSGGAPAQAAIWAAAGALLVALMWFLWPSASVNAPEISTKRLSQEIPLTGSLIAVDISPDGSKIAYSSDILRVLDLKTGVLREIPEAGSVIHVEFSPDSESLLLTEASGISRVSVSGGTVFRIYTSDEAGPRAAWASDNLILFEENQSIFRLSLSSGDPIRITTPDSLVGEYDHDWPSLLPDGRTVMATAERLNAEARIGFWDMETGENRGYLDYPGYRPQWVPTGHLLFAMNETAVALPFDVQSLSQTGPVIPVMSETRAEGLSVSDEGTLVHAGAAIGLPGEALPVVPASFVPGHLEQHGFPPDYYRDLVLSPDAKEAAVVIQYGRESSAGQDIWVLDLDLGTRRQITQGGINDFPTWMPDGTNLLYVRTRFSSDVAVMIQAADGTGDPRVFWDPDVPALADLDVSEDGTKLVAITGSSVGMAIQTNGVLIDLVNSREIYTWSTDSGNPRRPAISPNGKYVAYEDRGSILVRSTEQESSVPVTVWSETMSLPRWARDGSKLFAIGGDGIPQVIDVQTNPRFAVAGSPEMFVNWGVAGVKLFDVYPGAQRILLPVVDNSVSESNPSLPAEDRTMLHLVINWFAELEEASGSN